jgi:hypothetical protein
MRYDIYTYVYMQRNEAVKAIKVDTCQMRRRIDTCNGQQRGGQDDQSGRAIAYPSAPSSSSSAYV